MLCFKDNHLDKYKNHVIKPSLEVGSSGYCGAIFVGENIDETYFFEWPDLEFQPDNEGAPLSSSQYQIPEGARGPFQTSITIHVQNLVVTSLDETKRNGWSS